METVGVFRKMVLCEIISRLIRNKHECFFHIKHHKENEIKLLDTENVHNLRKEQNKFTKTKENINQGAL